jgi:hypothetical protein
VSEKRLSALRTRVIRQVFKKFVFINLDCFK